MKQSPFPSLAVFARVLVKALVIAAAFNFVLLALGANPVRALVRLNTYDLLGQGRARLAYPSDFQNGQLPLDALLEAHAISQPKAPDEFRVVLLGESGIAGWGVPDEATLSAQLTARGIAVGGRRLVAYNLAYPQPSAARDLLVLDASLAYSPDLVIWFVTPATLNDAPDAAGQNRVFFDLNSERLAALSQRYDGLISGWYAEHAPELLAPEPAWQRAFAIRDQDLLPVWWNSLLYPFIPPDLAASDRRIGSEPVPEEARYPDDAPGFRTMPNATWQFLQAGCRHAVGSGVQLLVINEPMAVGGGPYADVNYNALYARALYDRYRVALEQFAGAHGLWYADRWDAVPPEHFTDTPNHMDAAGFARLADVVERVLHEGGTSACD